MIVYFSKPFLVLCVALSVQANDARKWQEYIKVKYIIIALNSSTNSHFVCVVFDSYFPMIISIPNTYGI